MWKNLLTLLISTVLCVAVFWWVASLLQPEEVDQLPGYGSLVEYDPDRPGGHLKPGINQLVSGEKRGQGVPWVTNSDGFRNDHEVSREPEPGTLRILFYGDSFVDGMRTGQENTIGAVLERELEKRLGQAVEVLISGHNNPANAWYHWQAHGRFYQPNLVILGLTVGNDLTSHNFGAGVMPEVRDFTHMVSVDPSVPHAGIGNGQLLIPDGGFLPAAQRSRLELMGNRINQALAGRFYFLSNRARPAMGPLSGEPGKAPAGGFFVSLGLYYKGDIPFINSMWRDFETLLPGFVAQVRHFGSRPLMVSFPTRIEALPGDWERLVRALQLDSRKFDLGVPGQRLKALCERLDMPCLDTAAALREGYGDGQVFRPLGDMHLSEHGQAVTAHAMAGFVEELLEMATAPPPGPGWLDQYRSTVQQWTEGVLEDAAPWLDSRSGGARLDVSQNKVAMESMLTGGWYPSGPGEAFWAGEGTAMIRLPIARPGQEHQIVLAARPFLHEANGLRQRVWISVQGEPVGEQVLDVDDFTDMQITLPADQANGPWTTIELEFPDALVPSEIGLSSDRRRLGIAVVGLEFHPHDSEARQIPNLKYDK
jgi:hypothetical protein